MAIHRILSGIDRLDILDKELSGRRLAVMTGGGAVNRALVPALDALCGRYNVKVLLNTIYGVRGEFIYGERVPEYVDKKTGLTALSVFNRERIAPSPEMLSGVDDVVFDIREAGTRFFEYLHCLGALMKACAAQKKRVVVLDRVAPLGGDKVEGTVCPDTMHTIVGDYALASRTALTIGEFARYINAEFAIGCELCVVPLAGWTRDMYYDDTDVPWLLPSPSLNGPTANLLYAGYCLFEGVSTVSEGRGTSKPFELVGAPWIDADALKAQMDREKLPGARFASVCFKPVSSKFAGEVCHGLQTIVDDKRAFEPFLTALTMLEAICAQDEKKIAYADCSAGHDVLTLPSAPEFTLYIDKLLATDAFTSGRMSARALNDSYAEAREAYAARKRPYHLY